MAEQIAHSVTRDCVVVVKSTVPIGTNDKVEALLNAKSDSSIHIHVASNPEFLAQGTAVRDTLHASRIVIGVEEPETGELLKAMYQEFDAPILVTNRKSAEMIKYASNDFLALKISYVNEIALLCELVGADIDDVTRGMGYDSRIGNKFLQAGIGYGGSCFPKDTKALHWLANFHDYEIKTIKAAIEVNENQKLKPIKIARKYFDSLEGLTIAVLGLTFKPGTDDLREAPSWSIFPSCWTTGRMSKRGTPSAWRTSRSAHWATSHTVTPLKVPWTAQMYALFSPNGRRLNIWMSRSFRRKCAKRLLSTGATAMRLHAWSRNR